MRSLYWAVVLISAIAVAVDAANLNARRGRLGGGFLDMGPVSWFFAVVLLWFIAILFYLGIRPQLVAWRDYEQGQARQAGPYGPSPYGGPPSARPTYAPHQDIPVYAAPQHRGVQLAPQPMLPPPGLPTALFDPHTGALVALPAPPPTARLSAPPADESTLAELARLSAALHSGELTEQEYEAARHAALSTRDDRRSA